MNKEKREGTTEIEEIEEKEEKKEMTKKNDILYYYKLANG